jgi:hypothetical protein
MRVGLAIICVGVWLTGCSDNTRTIDGSGQPAASGSHSNGGMHDATDSDGGSDMGGGICTRAGDCEQHIAIASALHQTGAIDYPIKPPVGGNHNPCWGQWRVYDTPLPVENWVHNLEHGGVVLLYNCPDGCKAEVSDLSDFVGAHPRTLLTKYTDMDKRFAVIAWEYRLLMDDLDLDAVDEFYVAHFDQAPESIDSAPSSCP